MKMRLRTLFVLTLIAALGSLLVRHRRDAFVWTLAKVPAIRLIAPQSASSAWESRLEEAKLTSGDEAISLLNAMLKGRPMERDFAFKHFYDFPPQLVARNSAELVDVLADPRYPWLCNAACDQLIRVGPLAKHQVPRLLEIAKDSEQPWHKFRIEYVLTAIGDFSPEVLHVINDIRSLRVYKQTHPNTNLHPNTGLHYIDSAHLSDRHRSAESACEPDNARESPN
jgi:hypothetical protein